MGRRRLQTRSRSRATDRADEMAARYCSSGSKPMSRRQGSVRPRGKAFEIRWQVAGRTKTETVRGSRKLAEKRLRGLLAMAEVGHAPSRDTLAAWLDEWLRAIRGEVSPLTLHSYK